jgi:acetoin utilization protein AcuB
MLTPQLIASHYPTVKLEDKVSLVLQLMDDYDVLHMPVTREDKYVGLVAKDDLLDADEEVMLATLECHLIKAAVKEDDHFLTAVKLCVDHNLTLIPIITKESEVSAVLSNMDLLKAMAKFTGTEEPGGIIVLEMEKRNFSFSDLGRLVETNDAYITQLNTFVEPDTNLILVTIKVNKFEISDIVATFQRYEYIIRYYFGEESYTNELKDNYDSLMHYLNI